LRRHGLSEKQAARAWLPRRETETAQPVASSGKGIRASDRCVGKRRESGSPHAPRVDRVAERRRGGERSEAAHVVCADATRHQLFAALALDPSRDAGTVAIS